MNRNCRRNSPPIACCQNSGGAMRRCFSDCLNKVAADSSACGYYAFSVDELVPAVPCQDESTDVWRLSLHASECVAADRLTIAFAKVTFAKPHPTEYRR